MHTDSLTGRISPLDWRLGRLMLCEGLDRKTGTWPVFHSVGGELVAHFETEETTLLPATDALLPPPADDAPFAGAIAGAATVNGTAGG